MTKKDKNSLKHHGISGQKWGVKNGPPYPLIRGKRKTRKRVIKEGVQYKNRKILDKIRAPEDLEGALKSYKDQKYDKPGNFYYDLSQKRTIKKGTTVYAVVEPKTKLSETNKDGIKVTVEDPYGIGVRAQADYNKGKTRINAYKLDTDILVPSIQKMTESFVNTIFPKDKSKTKQYLKEYNELTKEEKDRVNKNAKEFKKALKKDPTKAMVMAYTAIMSSDSSGNLAHDLKRNLQVFGYNAIPNFDEISKRNQSMYYIFDTNALSKPIETRKIKEVQRPYGKRVTWNEMKTENDYKEETRNKKKRDSFEYHGVGG